MTFDESDIEELIERLQRDTQLRDRVRSAILADDFLALPGLIRQLGERLAELAAAQGRFEVRLETVERRLDQIDRRLDQMDKRLDQVDKRLDQVDKRLDQVDKRLAQMERRLDHLDGRVGNLEGWRFEHTYIENLGSRLGGMYLRTRRVQLNEIAAMNQALDAGTITLAQWGDASKLDFVAYAVERAGSAEELLLAAELSVVVDETDVRRARQRADVLRAAGLNAVAMVDGEVILPDAAKLADQLSVRYWLQPRTAA